MSSLGQFNALLCVSAQGRPSNDSFLSIELRAIGKKDLLNIPALTWKHPRFRTPILAIIINTVLCSVVSVLPFSSLVRFFFELF